MALTIKEAIAKGYTHWGISGKDFQSLHLLEDSSDLDLTESIFPDSTEFPVLAGKKTHYLSIGETELFDFLSEHIQDGSDFADDTEAVPDALKSGVDWAKFSSDINKALKDVPYWFLTDIKLIPETK